jgi:hypothetical protein
MRLEQKDIIDKHKNIPAIIFGHGPNLDESMQDIALLQNQQDSIFFSLNNWFQLYEMSKSPDYWVFASTVDTIDAYYEQVEKHNSTILFADTVDLVSINSIEENLDIDFLPYDQRHFKNHTCTQIWHGFLKHYEENGNNNFADYGNNTAMWQAPDDETQFPPIRWALPVSVNGSACCTRIQDVAVVGEEAKKYFETKEPIDWTPTKHYRLTVQEELQRVSQHDEHYSPGDTVILHAIAFAIIMGCNPIYIGGMDLDYAGGYVGGNSAPLGADDVWNKQQSNLINDLRILNESAKNRGIQIINLQQKAWYGQFASYDYVIKD